MQQKVPFYFGLGSRYSYLAATQLDLIEYRANCRFEWLPLQSAELIRRANGGTSPFEGSKSSGQYDWAYRERDAKDWADYYGVPYEEPANPGHDTADMAKACLVAGRSGKLKPMCMAIFRAKFVDGADVDREVLSALAAEQALDGESLIAQLDAPEIVAEHEDLLARALKAGVFGVPAFQVGDKVFWGNDRLPLVEHTLARQP